MLKEHNLESYIRQLTSIYIRKNNISYDEIVFNEVEKNLRISFLLKYFDEPEILSYEEYERTRLDILNPKNPSGLNLNLHNIDVFNPNYYEFVKKEKSLHLKYLEESFLKDSYFASLTFQKKTSNFKENLMCKYKPEKTLDLRTRKFIYSLDIEFFNEFIKEYNEEPFIYLNSYIDLIEWDLNLLLNGRYIFDWNYLQSKKSLEHFFTNFENLEILKDVLDWDEVFKDNRLIWNTELIKKFIHKARNNPARIGNLSRNPNHDQKTIFENYKIWNINELSKGKAILKIDNLLTEYLHIIDLESFSKNHNLTYKDLNIIRDFYQNKHLFVEGIFHHNGHKINWNFKWENVFKNLNIKWDIKNIEPFLEILDEDQENWRSLSYKIENTELALKYFNKFKIKSLAFNNNVEWNVEMIKNLLNLNLGLFDVKWYGTGLPSIIRCIKISNEALLHFKDFWAKKYIYESVRFSRSEGSIYDKGEFPLYNILLKNVYIDKEFVLKNIVT